MLFSGGGSYSVFFFITKRGFKLSTITEKTDEVFRTLKFNTQKNNWLKFWASTYSDCLSLLIPSILHIDAGNAWPLWKKKNFSISLIILDAKVLNEIPFDHKFYNFTRGWYFFLSIPGSHSTSIYTKLQVCIGNNWFNVQLVFEIAIGVRWRWCQLISQKPKF